VLQSLNPAVNSCSSTIMVVEKRLTWESKTEFILSIVGYGVGLGNVLRFPYLCYKSGGGAFLVPYFIMLFFCGIPVFFMESALGQFASMSAITIYQKLAPGLKGMAYAAILVNIICTMQYNLQITYPILYFIDSFRDELPWKSCDNSWNSENCVVLNGNGINVTGEFKTAAYEYFHTKILNISSGPGEFGELVTPVAIVNVISWTILFLCLSRGVRSMGKVVYFTATFPYIILFILLIRGLTLPGAYEGIKAYLVPEVSEIWNLNVWADAAVQIFFSLGPGWGGLINMASYNKFKNNIQLDSVFLPLFNSFTSLFAGLVVFSILGFLSHETGVPVREVASEGPALAFITYPEALGLLPFPHFFSVSFFLMLYTLGIDSCLVQTETCVTCITDQWPQLRAKKHWVAFFTVLIMAAGSFLYVFRNGIYLIQLVDYYAYSLTVILICILEVFMITCFYGTQNFIQDINFMLERGRVWKIWVWSWIFVTPAILIFVFATVVFFSSGLSYNGVPFPDWCIAIGWLSSMVSLVIIPGYFMYKLSRFKGSLCDRAKACVSENGWGPYDPNDYEAWLMYKKQLNKS